jgi:hypothetical protein
MSDSQTSEGFEDELGLMEVDVALEGMLSLVDFIFYLFDDDSDSEESDLEDDKSDMDGLNTDESGNEVELQLGPLSTVDQTVKIRQNVNSDVFIYVHLP